MAKKKKKIVAAHLWFCVTYLAIRTSAPAVPPISFFINKYTCVLTNSFLTEEEEGCCAVARSDITRSNVTQANDSNCTLI